MGRCWLETEIKEVRKGFSCRHFTPLARLDKKNQCRFCKHFSDGKAKDN